MFLLAVASLGAAPPQLTPSRGDKERELCMDASTLPPMAKAIDRFDTRVRAVPDGRWDDPTPCTEWTVRDLVNHLVSEHLWATHILANETLEQVGSRYDGDLVGTEPVAAWEGAARGSRPRWAVADARATVHLSMGDAPLSTYAEQMFVDLTVHEWDLACGSGQDRSLDPDAVAFCLVWAQENVEQFAGLGIVAPPIPCTSDDPMVRMLALLGRDAAWSPR
ncbi:TIGR03086 family metal-binding protein [Promicromonospora sp. NPDC019610]|uniref:TIGR03086 family metal-binding protein n=1 Tax=Promicromonospora sp. NPDC019610 TaxID=3364405 RepID=UPI0037BD12CF